MIESQEFSDKIKERVKETHPTVQIFQGEDKWLHHFQLTWLEGEPQDYVGGILEGSF